MRLFSTVIFCLVLFGAVAAQTVSETTPSIDVPPTTIGNFKKIDDNLYRGGRPTEAGVAELKKLGIRTVVNLRNNIKDRDEEKAQVEAAGMTFVTIPLNIWFRPKRSYIAKFMSIVNEKAKGPVYVHCNLGADRTGMIVAVYRIAHDGWTAKQANAEAKDSGLGKWQIWIRDFINDYYRDFHAGRIR